MKKNWIYFLCMALPLGLGLTACDNNDDPDGPGTDRYLPKPALTSSIPVTGEPTMVRFSGTIHRPEQSAVTSMRLRTEKESVTLKTFAYMVPNCMPSEVLLQKSTFSTATENS